MTLQLPSWSMPPRRAETPIAVSAGWISHSPSRRIRLMSLDRSRPVQQPARACVRIRLVLISHRETRPAADAARPSTDIPDGHCDTFRPLFAHALRQRTPVGQVGTAAPGFARASTRIDERLPAGPDLASEPGGPVSASACVPAGRVPPPLAVPTAGPSKTRRSAATATRSQGGDPGTRSPLSTAGV